MSIAPAYQPAFIHNGEAASQSLLDQAQGQPAYANSNVGENPNPLHTQIKSDPISTPGYWRLLTTGAMARYIMRSTVDISRQLDPFQIFRTQAKEHAKDLIDEVKNVTATADAHSLEQELRAYNISDPKAFIQQYNTASQFHEQAHSSAIEALNTLGIEDSEKTLKKMHREGKLDVSLPNIQIKASRMQESALKGLANAKESGNAHAITEAQKHFDAVHDARLSVVEHIRAEYNQYSTVKNAESKLADNIRSRNLDTSYDVLQGMGSTALTSIYAWRVLGDIKNLFRETVAFETNKSPQDVTLKDIWKSDNKIVQSTWNNFIKENTLRLGGDALFFGRLLGNVKGLEALRAVNFGEIALGSKGALLVHDIMSKHTTLFQDTVQLVDRKLNPKHGIGDPITAGDVIDLYQKYSEIFHPHNQFKDATIHQNVDHTNWDEAAPIFNRIADLMNQTYKYKQSSLMHMAPEARAGIPAADFALPKLMYLLGHDLLQPKNPPLTMAYVEVANRYGINGVKLLQNTLQNNVPLGTALEIFPGVTIPPARAEVKHAQSALHAPVMVAPVTAYNVNARPQLMHSPIRNLPDSVISTQGMGIERNLASIERNTLAPADSFTRYAQSPDTSAQRVLH